MRRTDWTRVVEDLAHCFRLATADAYAAGHAAGFADGLVAGAEGEAERIRTHIYCAKSQAEYVFAEYADEWERAAADGLGRALEELDR